MKHIFTLLFITMLLTTTVYGATSTASADPEETTPTIAQKQLDDLKDRLATKVAQLRQTQRRAIAGRVKATSVSTVTVETKTSDVKIELTDDITVTQIIKGKRTELTTEDIAEDDNVVVFGDYDTGLELLKAKVIFIQAALPTRVAGRVTSVDAKEFTLTITTLAGQTQVIDIEKNTATLLWDKEKGLVKGGFSKVVAGESVHVVGVLQPKNENRLSATRIIDLGFVVGKPPTPTPTPQEAASESGTPKATPKATPTEAP